MKKTVFLACLAVNLCNRINAQNNTSSFNSLQTPSAPGFILLDQTPSAIEKPTTAQGFAMSALNLFQGGALEVTPFWLKPHPDLVVNDLMLNKGLYARTLGISVATVNLDSGKYISAGLRSRLYQAFSQAQRDKITRKITEIQNELSNPAPDWDKAQKLRDEYAELSTKPAFSLDIAMAFAGNSDSMTVNTIHTSRAAAWMALNWRPRGDDFYFTVLTRYLHNVYFENQKAVADIGDVGCRLNYDVDRFSISVEYLQRLNFTTSDYSSNRFALIASYQVSENLYFTGTTGKNFPGVKNLITMIGINFGVSSNKIKSGV